MQMITSLVSGLVSLVNLSYPASTMASTECHMSQPTASTSEGIGPIRRRISDISISAGYTTLLFNIWVKGDS